MRDLVEVLVQVERSTTGRLQVTVRAGDRDLGVVLLDELPILLEALHDELT